MKLLQQRIITTAHPLDMLAALVTLTALAGASITAAIDPDSAAAAWPLRPLPPPTMWHENTTLVYMRVQKTGSKTLVHLLEDVFWLRGDFAATCHKTGWIGQTTTTCKLGAATVLRRTNLSPAFR